MPKPAHLCLLRVNLDLRIGSSAIFRLTKGEKEAEAAHGEAKHRWTLAGSEEVGSVEHRTVTADGDDHLGM